MGRAVVAGWGSAWDGLEVYLDWVFGHESPDLGTAMKGIGD